MFVICWCISYRFFFFFLLFISVLCHELVYGYFVDITLFLGAKPSKIFSEVGVLRSLSIFWIYRSCDDAKNYDVWNQSKLFYRIHSAVNEKLCNVAGYFRSCCIPGPQIDEQDCAWSIQSIVNWSACWIKLEWLEVNDPPVKPQC